MCFACRKKSKAGVLVLQPWNRAQNVPWKKVGLGCNNNIALAYEWTSKSEMFYVQAVSENC